MFKKINELIYRYKPITDEERAELYESLREDFLAEGMEIVEPDESVCVRPISYKKKKDWVSIPLRYVDEEKNRELLKWGYECDIRYCKDCRAAENPSEQRCSSCNMRKKIERYKKGLA